MIASPGDLPDRMTASFYSNVTIIALWWITVISSRESNSTRESIVGVIDAGVGEMVGVALSVADVVGGGGGVYP
jgi:hypothetical protein